MSEHGKKTFSINRQITFLFYMLFAVIVIVALFIYIRYVKSSVTDSIESINNGALVLSNTIDTSIENINNQLQWLATSAGDSSLWSSSSSYDRKLYVDSILGNIHNLMLMSDTIEVVMIAQRSSDLIIESHTVDDEVLLEFFDTYNGRNQVVPSSPSIFSPQGSSDEYIVLSCPVSVKDRSGAYSRVMASAYLGMKTKSLIPKNTGTNAALLCTLEGGVFHVIASSENNPCESTEIEIDIVSSVFIEINERYRITATKLGFGNLYLLYLVPDSMVTSQFVPIFIIGVGVILAFLTFGWLGLLIIRRNLKKPLDNILYDTTRISEGEYSFRIRTSNADEFQQISESFNTVLDEMQERTSLLVDQQRRLYDMELLTKESQMRSLQTQINPHFLYNTLECVRSISDYNNIPEVSTIISGMSDIYRYSASSDIFGTIQTEFDCLKSYSNVMDVRFDKRFSIVLNMDSSAIQCMIPRMTLQPLVENSINHGLSLKRGKGVVEVSCSRTDDNLKIVVYDDGVGMSEEKLRELKARLSSGNLTEHNNRSIGLFNVDMRIKKAFGDEFGVSLESVQKQFTRVVIIIPAREHHDEELT